MHADFLDRGYIKNYNFNWHISEMSNVSQILSNILMKT